MAHRFRCRQKTHKHKKMKCSHTYSEFSTLVSGSSKKEALFGKEGFSLRFLRFCSGSGFHFYHSEPYVPPISGDRRNNELIILNLMSHPSKENGGQEKGMDFFL